MGRKCVFAGEHTSLESFSIMFTNLVDYLLDLGPLFSPVLRDMPCTYVRCVSTASRVSEDRPRISQRYLRSKVDLALRSTYSGLVDRFNTARPRLVGLHQESTVF